MNTTLQIASGPELEDVGDIDCDRSRIRLNPFPRSIAIHISTSVDLEAGTLSTHGIRICNAATGCLNNNVNDPKSVCPFEYRFWYCAFSSAVR